MDGTYLTQSDMHMWLAPFTRGKANYVYIELGRRHTISLMRVWNYNKSRIHSFRGVKDMRIQLDDATIFEGAIKKAQGNLNMKSSLNEQLFEVILFTSDDKLVKKISSSDWINSTNDQVSLLPESSLFSRPYTGSKALQDQNQRPTTSVRVSQFQQEGTTTSPHDCL